VKDKTGVRPKLTHVSVTNSNLVIEEWKLYRDVSKDGE